MAHHPLRYLIRETGLRACPAIYRDGQFYLALLAGFSVLTVSYFFFPVPMDINGEGAWALCFSLIIWQPFWEELLFRGILQGQLLKRAWGRGAWLQLSRANLLTSLAFAAMHLVYHPVLWAIAVFIPSLVFGYFRERHNCVYSAFVLHALYNLGYLVLNGI